MYVFFFKTFIFYLLNVKTENSILKYTVIYRIYNNRIHQQFILLFDYSNYKVIKNNRKNYYNCFKQHFWLFELNILRTQISRMKPSYTIFTLNVNTRLKSICLNVVFDIKRHWVFECNSVISVLLYPVRKKRHTVDDQSFLLANETLLTNAFKTKNIHTFNTHVALNGEGVLF